MQALTRMSISIALKQSRIVSRSSLVEVLQVLSKHVICELQIEACDF